MGAIRIVPKPRASEVAQGGDPPIDPSEWVYIVSSAVNSLPSSGTRVGTSNASNMPTIVSSSATGTPAIKTADGAAKYRLVGLNIQAHASGSNSAIVQIGGSETTLAEFPTDIIIDRCLVKGDDTSTTRRGVQLDAIRGALVDSYVYSILDTSDSQAVWAYNTPGPLKVVNNYLEATGENMMTGGSDPSYTDSIPSDIEVRKNYFYKPLSWIGDGWTIKNLLEFKNAKRVLVEGNVFENNWGGEGQSGFYFLLTPRNQNNTAPWCAVQDITYRYNKATNVDAGINILGEDAPNTSGRTSRVSISHNLMVLNTVNSGDLRNHQFIGGTVDVQYLNNTFLNLTASGTQCFIGDGGLSVKNTGTLWRDNIFAAGLYGIIGSGYGEGSSSFSAYFTSPTYNYNVMIGSSNTGSYGGTGNQFPANTGAVGFTDYAGGDYSLSGGSSYKGDGSDGNDPGVNWSTLQSKIAHSVDGAWGSADNLYSDSTYTNAVLPTSYVDTTYSLPTGGTTHVCTTAAEFTTALANCASGDVIQLTAGNTFTGSFTLRAR